MINIKSIAIGIVKGKNIWRKEKEEKKYLINVQYAYHEYLGIVIKLHSFKYNHLEINMDGIVKTAGTEISVKGILKCHHLKSV